jgi:hypothetical protein
MVMKEELVRQYAHVWRVFVALVEGYDKHAWIHTGRKAITPVRLAFHILKSAKYYLEDASSMTFASGKSFDVKWESAKEEDLPSQGDIILCIGEIKTRTEAWINEMDFTAKNTSFDWAGETKFAVVIFSMRHTLYHLGELSSLLNESKNGDTKDIYAEEC